MPEPKISEDGQTITCSDGTYFTLQREHGLHEPPWYSILRSGDGGTVPLVTDGEYDGSFRKSTVLARMRRRAREWEASVADEG